MTRYHLIRAYITEPIEAPERLVELINDARKITSEDDEGLILSAAITCPRELWQSAEVQEAVFKKRCENSDAFVIFRLLAASSFACEQRVDLEKIFKQQNARWLRTGVVLYLLHSLHDRGLVDLKEILIPKLHWYSRPPIWENAVLLLRVCAPSSLKRACFRRIASLKSIRARLLLLLFSADCADDSPQARHTLELVVGKLMRLPQPLHRSLLTDVGWICTGEGPNLGNTLAREMMLVCDYRDCEILMPFVTDQKTLSQIAAGPNPLAADWAKALLQNSNK